MNFSPLASLPAGFATGWSFDPVLSAAPLSTEGLSGGSSGMSALAGTGMGYAPLKPWSPSSGGFGFNVPTAQLGLSALGTLGSLYGAFAANNLAKKQFNFTKDITNTNLNNQIKSYNTALEDRSRSRAVVEGQSAATAQSYVDRNKLSR